MKVFFQQVLHRYYTVAIISTIVKVRLTFYLIKQQQQQKTRSALFFLSFLNPDVLSTPTNVIIKPEINSHLWSISTDDDCHLIDNLFSTNTINFNQQQQQNNNSSQLILNTDDKQLIGPIGSNLYVSFKSIFFSFLKIII